MDRNLLSGEGLSQHSADIGASMGRGFLPIPQAGNIPAPGFIDPFKNTQQQKHLETQSSSYYSRKNTHSQGSYNAVNLHAAKIGTPHNNFEMTTQQSSG